MLKPVQARLLFGGGVGGVDVVYYQDEAII